jgi:hypothetical protein
MRKVLLSVGILTLAATPALAGEIGAGGCNWAKKAVTADAVKIKPVEKIAVVDPTKLVPQISFEKVAKLVPALETAKL